MYDFDFWYAYFDSLYLNSKPNPHLSFIQTFNLKQLSQTKFPQCKKLPQLSTCFKEFEHFIYSQQSWIQCQCEQSALRQIQKCINSVVVLINIQKKYGHDFWHLKRRVQASICHFFALLTFFLLSLIPGSDPAQTLQNTKKCNKLCTSFKALETFVNKILPEINPIIKFLYQQSFSEEKQLTILFLQQIKQVLLNLPTMNKRKFKNQFQLAKYLYLIIPIELSKDQYKFKTKRKKAVTISNEVQMKYHSDKTATNQSNKSSFDDTGYISRRFSLSKLYEKQEKQIYRSKYFQKNNQQVNIEQHFIQNILTHQYSLPKMFQFSEKVRKCSFYITHKKITKATFNTRQTLELRNQNEKNRKISEFGKTSNSHSKQKQFERTFSNGIQRHNTNQTVRSKKSSLYRIRRKTEIEQSQKHRHHKEKSIAKLKHGNRTPKNRIINKPFTQQVMPVRPAKKVNLNSGDSKGWGIIQENFNKELAKNKIKELIHSININ